MYSQPPDLMPVPQGMPFVTKLKTKILQAHDYVLQCQNDEQALNGWRLLCGHGIAMVRLALNDGLLDKPTISNPEKWKALAQKVISNWPPKTSAKTSVHPYADGRVKASYDHYVQVVKEEYIDRVMHSLEQEKFNSMASDLMGFWGDCYSIALVAGLLDLEEEIELPVSREYTQKSLAAETQARRMPKRLNEARSPS